MPSVTDSDRLELRRIRKKLDSISGPGVRHTKESIYIGPQPQQAASKSRPLPPGIHFAVKVEEDGTGTNGNLTTAASYSYTVRTIAFLGYSGDDAADAAFLIKENAPVVRPRPNGEVIVQTGPLGYGVGFYDEDGEFRLWDAGEVPDTGPC